MKKLPRISEAEWKVMRLLWRAHPRTAADLIEELRATTDWGPATIKTLLNRLLQKRALKYRKEGKTYLYSPAVSESDCQRQEARSFLARVFGGSISPMLAHLAEAEDLTPDELAEIEAIVKSKRVR